MKDIEKELAENKKLIEMTKGDENADGDSGSDSEPSEDNLSEDEMAKIIPLKKKPEPAKPATKPKPLNMKKDTKREVPEPKSPSS